MNYYLAVNEEAKGPYTLEQLRSMWNAGSITGDMFFCQEGDAEWHPLNDILQQLQSTPAPATPPPSPPLQPPPMTEKVKESAPKKKKSFLAKVGYALLFLIGAPILLAIILPMCSKTSTQTTDLPPRPVASNTQSGGSSSTAAKVAPKASAVQPAVAATSTPAPVQEPFPKEGSWPTQVHLLKNTQLSGAVGSIGYNAGTEVFAFLSDDHKTVTVQVEQLKATIPIEDTDFLALARINQGKKEEAAKHEQERMNAEAAARAAATPSPQVNAVCDDMIKGINTIVDFTLTGVMPSVSKNTGVLTLLTISSKPVLSEPRKKKLWLLTAVAAAGKALSDHPDAKIDSLWLSDADTVHESKQGYLMPADAAKKLQRQVYDGTISPDQMYEQIGNSLSLVKSPALE